jgi:hypothetical protein
MSDAPSTVNVYCDESCHLEHDHQPAMVLGAVWCLQAKVREVSERLREIKRRHGMSPTFEMKWTKVSDGKIQMYLDFVDYFFDDDHLHFRALVIPDKSALDHARFKQTHDEWYYKMYFHLLTAIIDPEHRYEVYLDIKDTHGGMKTRKLREVLSNDLYDFRRELVARIQIVRSEEVQLVQLTDLLLGAVSYVNRGLSGNLGKEKLVDRMKKRSGYSLTRTTLLREQKVNLLRWRPYEVENA